jgi:hypothetical protein
MRQLVFFGASRLPSCVGGAFRFYHRSDSDNANTNSQDPSSQATCDFGLETLAPSLPRCLLFHPGLLLHLRSSNAA